MKESKKFKDHLINELKIKQKKNIVLSKIFNILALVFLILSIILLKLIPALGIFTLILTLLSLISHLLINWLIKKYESSIKDLEKKV